MRRKSYHKDRERSVFDDINDFEREALAPVVPNPPVALRPPVRASVAVEDRRNWDPAPEFGARDVFGRIARIGMTPKRQQSASRAAVNQKPPKRMVSLRMSDVMSFYHPKSVSLCLRRKARREVLFAKKKTGKGARSRKRWTEWSNVRC